MTGKDRQVRFKVGDRAVALNSNRKATITRLCADKSAIYVRWDKDNSQGMVETKTLRKE